MTLKAGKSALVATLEDLCGASNGVEAELQPTGLQDELGDAGEGHLPTDVAAPPHGVALHQ